jgi:hypothetical protein
LWYAAKAELTGKFIALNAYMRKDIKNQKAKLLSEEAIKIRAI